MRAGSIYTVYNSIVGKNAGCIQERVVIERG